MQRENCKPVCSEAIGKSEDSRLLKKFTKTIFALDTRMVIYFLQLRYHPKGTDLNKFFLCLPESGSECSACLSGLVRRGDYGLQRVLIQGKEWSIMNIDWPLTSYHLIEFPVCMSGWPLDLNS